MPVARPGQLPADIDVGGGQIGAVGGAGGIARRQRFGHAQQLAAVRQRFGGTAGVEQHIAELAVVAQQFAPQRDIGAGSALHVFAQGQGLAVAVDGAGGVAQAGRTVAALHVAHLLVRGRQFALQSGVAGRFGAQTVQVAEGALDQQLPRPDGPGQRLDGVVDFEQQGIRQAAHVLKAALGTRPLHVGDVGLAQRGGHSSHQG